MRILALIGIGFIVAACVAVIPADALAQGCAMCKTALDGPMDPTTEAFNVSSLFLMAAPYTVVGTVGVWMYFSARRGDRDPEHDTELE
jgi:hypothetical protein